MELDLPAGFQADVPIENVSFPTTLEFADDGRIFIAERDGTIRVFEGVNDQAPHLFADFSAKVFTGGDRGLLGMALDPGFPQQPYVYVGYTYDYPAVAGQRAPDTCPDNDPNAFLETCVARNRVSRFTMDPQTGAATVDAQGNPVEQVLVEGWCQQFNSHSVGDLEFDPAGVLYASGGDGASFTVADKGQLDGTPCGDPPDEGGALRSQDLRTAGDPTDYGGSLLRFDPDTGAALSGNPLFGSSDVSARRILGHGLRNPFRFEFRPGTSDLYIQDTGWNSYEEIQRISQLPAQVRNFGWPCYEGPSVQPAYDALNVGICESLYSAPPTNLTGPFYHRARGASLYPGDTCPVENGAASTGMAFETGVHFPAAYNGALFFADSARGCIWSMQAGAGGVPNPSAISTFATSGTEFEFVPVDVVEGPDGALYIPNFWASEIVRVRHFAGNAPPIARLQADQTYGPTPLEVNLDASASSDANGDPLEFEWDLDGDGQFDDASGIDPQAQRTYTASSNVLVGVRASDSYGASDSELLQLYPGNNPPAPVIDQPSAALAWAIGDTINFAGHATDPDQGNLGATALDWSVTTEHCPNACHSHPLIDLDDSAGGTFVAPEHEHPSHLLMKLTATDARGLSATTSVQLNPRLIELQLRSEPQGVSLGYNADTAPAPFTVDTIAGSSANIAAPETAQIDGETWLFSNWSDGGSAVHTISARDSATYTASYVDPTPPAAVTDPPDDAKTPKIKLRLASDPPGIRLSLAGLSRPAPFTRKVALGGSYNLRAPGQVVRGGHVLTFERWRRSPLQAQRPRARWHRRVVVIRPKAPTRYVALYGAR